MTGHTAAVRFGPDVRSLAPVAFLLVGALALAASSRWLLLVLVVPLACAIWVLRARVVADADGLTVSNGLRTAQYAWTQVAGFDVPRRGPVRLLPVDGGPVRLTALPRRALPRLLAVGSGGTPELP